MSNQDETVTITFTLPTVEHIAHYLRRVIPNGIDDENYLLALVDYLEQITAHHKNG